MATFTMIHDIACGTETFWKVFFDKEFSETLFLKNIGFSKWVLLEQRETDTEIIRRIEGIPKMDVPAPVAKVLGPGFGYSEEGTYDKKTGIYKYALKTTVMADKLKNGGSVRVEKVTDTSCRRIVDIYAEAKVFGIGGLIEANFEKSFRDGWQTGAEFFNKWVKEKGLV
jgi:hypothetical protein